MTSPYKLYKLNFCLLVLILINKSSSLTADIMHLTKSEIMLNDEGCICNLHGA